MQTSAKSNTPKRHDNILVSLADSDDVTPAIKAVFEAGVEGTFGTSLQKFGEEKEQEIRSICQAYYMEFIGTVGELMNVREASTMVKARVEDLNGQLQALGTEAVTKSEEAMRLRTVRRNIAVAQRVLGECRHAVQLVMRLEQRLAARQFYEAIKVLDQLHHIHVHSISEFELGVALERRMPVYRERICDESTKDFRLWLESILIKGTKLGALAIGEVRIRNAQELAVKTKQKALHAARMGDDDGEESEGEAPAAPSSAASATSPVAARGTGASHAVIADEDEQRSEDSIFVRAGVVLTPVYQCLYIFEKLRQRERFQRLYKENRQLQASNIVSPWSGSKASFEQGYATFFNQITGFLVIEDTVMKTTLNFLSKGEIDAMWESAVVKIQTVLQQQLAYCVSTDNLLTIKESLGLFSQTMASFGFRVSQLEVLGGHVRDRFTQLLMQQCNDAFLKCFAEDTWEPMAVQTAEAFNDLRAVYKFETPEGAKGPDGKRRYPLRLPFSQSVPRICVEVRGFVTSFFQFAENLPEMEEYIRKALDQLLIRHLNEGFLNLIDDAHAKSLAISQVVQVSINLGHLASACAQFEEFFALFRRNKMRVPLTAASCLHETRVRAEDLIFELVDVKINSFMAMAEYDWTPSRKRTEASDYMRELVQYVDAVLRAHLENLPEAVRHAVYFTACKRIAKRLVGFLCEDSTRKFNLEGVETLGVDVQYIERWANATGIGALPDCFREPEQLVLLITSDRMEEVLDADVRRTKYSELMTPRIIAVLEKYKEDGSSLFGRRKKSDRQTAIENVVRALRAATYKPP